ncbi:hypothetical protein LBMAG42_53640 [Deltaproteobacteria bacterium]|nr:hypothetical protein LBMAG42_53640 [Deltaproteobacteria bacterium]
MFAMILLFVSLAHAGDPYRCVATVAPPVPTCAVHGTFTVTAGAKTEAAATKAARAALAKALVKTAESFQLAQPAADPAELAGCSAVGDAAHVDCFPDAGLKETRFCLVTLADTECWGGDVLELEDVGWKVFEAGTDKMCAAVDAKLVTQNYTDVAVRRAKCAAACLSQTQVRCP